MKQVFVSGKGEVQVLEVPAPMPLPHSVLVQNVCSLISTGTESAAVSKHSGWLGAFEKATRSKNRVEQVWKMAKTIGVTATFEAVTRKLGDVTAAGYSCCGVVLEVSGANVPFAPGDRLACMGVGFANHAEYVTIPAQLCSKIGDSTSFEEGSFGAIGCIALQGIRRLDLTPGEFVGVIGLGLIGQISVQILKALGYIAVGLDVSTPRVELAQKLSGSLCWNPAVVNSAERVNQLTGGRGLDGLLICAATSSDEPVNSAFDLCRSRGRVCVVGDVGLNIDRQKMYRKELELRISCSYGPGRYDDEYEIGGRDYPYAHVRWTEGRNLELFSRLLANRQLSLEPLITAKFPLADAPAAYGRLKTGGALSVLFNCGSPPKAPQPLPTAAYTSQVINRTQASNNRAIKLGLVGCGAFVKSVHLPNLEKLSSCFSICGVVSRSGASAEIIARKYKIPVATSELARLLGDKSINAVLIATRHSSHASLVRLALENGKHVFVEKPLCLNPTDGYELLRMAKEKGLILRVGFNRRFAPALLELKKRFCSGPKFLTCRINLGPIGTTDWSCSQEEGGRLLGEGVHFFDISNWLMGSNPIRVQATTIGPPNSSNTNVTATFEYPNGGISVITYTTLGSTDAGKEWFELIGGRSVGQCDDYLSVKVRGHAAFSKRYPTPDKGHLAALREFHDAILGIPSASVGADGLAGLVATIMARAAISSASLQQSLFIETT